MIDYKAIADADAGGTLDAAYAILAAETITTNPEKKMSYLSIANEVGFTEATELSKRVPAVLEGWVDAALKGDGIDVNNPQTSALVNSLVDANFTQAMADAVLAAGNVSTPKYPSLKIGHLANARDMRARGVI